MDRKQLIYVLWVLINTILVSTGNIKYVQAKDKLLQKNNKQYNIIIIFLDSLRADHLGCYGYFRDTSPHIDELAKNGILFEWAIAQSNFTLPSVASLFTSKYVHSHKTGTVENYLSDKEVTLAEALKDNGYKTAAFICNAGLLDPMHGLNQGFDVYDFVVEEDRRLSFEKTMPAALKWIGQHKDSRFFVLLHSNNLRQPYHSVYENFFDPDYKGRLDNEYLEPQSLYDRKLTRREIEHVIAHYDGGIKYVDSFVGELMQKLRDWDLLDKTIIILLSDHGELLADHGMMFGHQVSLYDAEVRVPLIMIHPGIKKRGIRIHKQVQLIDVMPTVLDFLDIDGDNIRMEGRSLVELIEGNEGEDFNRYVYAECITNYRKKETIFNYYKVMVRTSLWKLIGSVLQIEESRKETLLPHRIIQLDKDAIISTPGEGGYELYDLKRNPKETKNLIGQGHEKIEAELLDKLLSY